MPTGDECRNAGERENLAGRDWRGCHRHAGRASMATPHGMLGRVVRVDGAGYRSSGGKRWGELARPPQLHHLLQAGEKPRQGGQNQDVHGRHDPGPGSVVGSLVADLRLNGGNALGQERGAFF